MTSPNLTLFDASLSLLGALGIWPALIRLYKQDSMNPLEVRLWGILASMMALFLVRFPLTGLGMSAFGGATYVAAVWLAFFVFLYFEGLLRRHMPFWLKIYVTLGSAAFIIDSLMNKLAGNRPHLIVFGAFLLSVQTMVILISLFRNRSELSRSENTLIDVSIVGLLLLVPLFLSDVVTYNIEHLPRLGALGGLLFTYFSLFNQALVQNRRFIFRKLVKTLLFAAVLLLPASLLFSDFSWDVGPRLYVFFVGLLLVFRIHSAVKLLNGEDEFFKFAKSLVEAEKFDKASLHQKIGDLFGKTEFKIISSKDLNTYNSQKIVALFKKNNTHLFNLEQVRQILADEIAKTALPLEEVQAYEEIQHLLYENTMNYICLLSEKSVDLLLLHIPYVAYTEIVHTQTALLRDYAQFLDSSPTAIEE